MLLCSCSHTLGSMHLQGEGAPQCQAEGADAGTPEAAQGSQPAMGTPTAEASAASRTCEYQWEQVMSQGCCSCSCAQARGGAGGAGGAQSPAAPAKQQRAQGRTAAASDIDSMVAALGAMQEEEALAGGKALHVPAWGA